MSVREDNAASRNALRRAAEYIAAALRHAAPSEASAEAWHIESAGDHLVLRNRDLGAWATALNKRHMFFGNWGSGPKVATNYANPERSDWDRRALEFAANEAARRFGDDWIRSIADESEWKVEQ